MLIVFGCCGLSVVVNAQKIQTLVIDAGHGGKDPGCHGAIHHEKDVSLAVALRLGALIDSVFPELNVVYTRTTDVFVELEARAQIANKSKADLFISIHCNAAGKPVTYTDALTGKQKVRYYTNGRGRKVPLETSNPVPYGSETYVMGLKNEAGKMQVASRENSVMLLEDNFEKTYQGFDPEKEESYIIMSHYTQSYVMQSALLGKHIQDAYGSLAGRIDKGVHRQSIWVLWRTAMPSVLTEIGYLTNPKEECFLGHKNGQFRIAWSIFSGFCAYKKSLDPESKSMAEQNIALPKIDNENRLDVDLCSDWPETTSKKPVVNTPAVVLDTTVVVIPKNTPVYKIQILSSPKKIDLQAEVFKDVAPVDVYEMTGIYKYTCGQYLEKNKAMERLKTLKSMGFSGAFIVVFKNGVRVNSEDL